MHRFEPAIRVAVALLASVATNAFAMPSPEVVQACRSDAARLCPGMKPGDDELGRCMREHKEAVSPGCKGALRAAHVRNKDGAGRGGAAGSGGQLRKSARD